MPAHQFTVDVEEYFHVAALEPWISRASWRHRVRRAHVGIEALLPLLAEHHVTATFFILGWLARRDSSIVRHVVEAGHEIASHGWDHRPIGRVSRREFQVSVRDSKALLEDISGHEVAGFRAPCFSVRPGDEWVFDVLIEEGYRYDSSILPARRRSSGYPGAPRTPHWLARPAGTLLELPIATLRIGNLVLPAGGGAYLRLLPYALVAGAFRQLERQQAPGTFYVHPWELDAGQPRLSTDVRTRVRQYGGIEAMPRRISRLLKEFRFQAIRDFMLAEPFRETSLAAAGRGA